MSPYQPTAVHSRTLAIRFRYRYMHIEHYGAAETNDGIEKNIGPAIAPCEITHSAFPSSSSSSKTVICLRIVVPHLLPAYLCVDSVLCWPIIALKCSIYYHTDIVIILIN